jgi:hypothetical protein
MPRATIDRVIINSPFDAPARHWRYERETRSFDRVEGRRPAGYVVASGDSRAFDDPGIFVEVESLKVMEAKRGLFGPVRMQANRARFWGAR